ncbi:MAG: hypothetical protein GXO26_09995 [Crenarchaeota archaeon]|nr:hypothetical protein [Thermoproteota archaeon]
MRNLALTIIHIRALARVLNFIAEFSEKHGRDPYTREVLRSIRTWGHGHKIIKLAEKLGLIERYEDKHPTNKRIKCKYNTITGKGSRFLSLVQLIADIDTKTEEEPESEEEPP